MGEGDRLAQHGVDVRVSALRAVQVGDGRERGEPRRRKQIARCAVAVAVGGVVVGRVHEEAAEVLRARARVHRALAGGVRRRVRLVSTSRPSGW